MSHKLPQIVIVNCNSQLLSIFHPYHSISSGINYKDIFIKTINRNIYRIKI